jgi:hypothetical protein
MDPAQPSVWTAYTRDALQLLAGCIESFQLGSRASYRVAAVELRLLLCDTNRIHERLVDISLLPRAYPEIKFHPLRSAPPAQEGYLVGFDRTREPVPLADWLSQSLTIPHGGKITLRELIRTICEQDGGAHVDPRFHSPLLGWEGRVEATIAIGKYVVEQAGEYIEKRE